MQRMEVMERSVLSELEFDSVQLNRKDAVVILRAVHAWKARLGLFACVTTLAPWAHCRREEACSGMPHDECDSSFGKKEWPSCRPAARQISFDTSTSREGCRRPNLRIAKLCPVMNTVVR